MPTLAVDVYNSYKSNLFGAGHAITVAAERNVTLTESGINCRVDNHVVDVKLEDRSKLSKKALEHFPVIFRFDDNYKFLGLTISGRFINSAGRAARCRQFKGNK